MAARPVRGRVVVRDAAPTDVEQLHTLWRPYARALNWETGESRDEMRTAMQRQRDDPDQRLLVAEIDDELVGMLHVRRMAVSPLHLDEGLHMTHLTVRSGFRRRGVGKHLLLEATTWAGELGLNIVTVTAGSRIRELQRFLAQVGFGQAATLRVTTAGQLRHKLLGHGAGLASGGTVAARRRMRRRAGG